MMLEGFLFLTLPRCAECGWEIVDGECAHCGMVYLNFVEHGGLDVDSDSESIPTFFGREVDDEVFSSDSDMDDFIARDDAILYESDDHEDPLQSDNDSVDDHGAPGSRNVVLSSDGEPDQENNLHCSSGSDVDSEIEAVMPRRTGSAANLINDSDSDNENGNILSSGGSSRGSNRVIFSDDDE